MFSTEYEEDEMGPSAGPYRYSNATPEPNYYDYTATPVTRGHLKMD